MLWKQPLQYLSDCYYAITLAQNSLKMSVDQFFGNFKLPLDFSK